MTIQYFQKYTLKHKTNEELNTLLNNLNLIYSSVSITLVHTARSISGFEGSYFFIRCSIPLPFLFNVS